MENAQIISRTTKYGKLLWDNMISILIVVGVIWLVINSNDSKIHSGKVIEQSEQKIRIYMEQSDSLYFHVTKQYSIIAQLRDSITDIQKENIELRTEIDNLKKKKNEEIDNLRNSTLIENYKFFRQYIRTNEPR